ncbi:30 kDa heat shock protein [Xylaria intraflava]|nr:30 kDa heat shock protein [Xylaria intraflava]
MSFFTHHPFYTAHHNNQGDFGGLVRFIDNWDKHFAAQTGRSCHQAQPFRHARRSAPTFSPRFDVRETEQNYELHGELPGIEKKDINIEFSDAQTIVVSGKVERSYTEGTAPAGTLDSTTMSGVLADRSNDEASETSSNKSFQATVEDDYEEIRATPSSTTVESSKPEKPVEETPKPENASGAQPKPKYWISERSIGNFSRYFVFSNRVDHDNVEASLNNGILTVIVPKAKPESRRVAIH